MADTSASDAPPAEAIPPDLPVDAPPAPDTEAPATGSLYVVGFVDSTGQQILSDTAEPDDGTNVWLAEDPENRMSLADMDDQYGEGAILWDAEPEPFEGSGPAPQAQLAALMGDADMLDEVESKIASLEGLVAGLMVTSLEDARFADDEPDADEDELDQTARVAAAVTAAREYLDILAHTAATSAEDEMAAEDDQAIADATDEADADGGDAEADAEDEDTGKRYEDLLARLGKLEATIAGLMETTVEDEELLPDDDMDRAIIDERPGMMAG